MRFWMAFLLLIVLLSGCAFQAPSPPDIPKPPPPTPSPSPAPTPAPTPTPVVDSIAPSVPRGVLARSLTCTKIEVSWLPSRDTGDSDLAGYRLYRNSVLAATTSETRFVDENLDPNTFFSYSVKSFDAIGNLSSASLPSNATTTACAVGQLNAWSKPIGGAGTESIASAAVSSYDHVVAVGDFDQKIQLGSTELNSAGDRDVFAVKYFSTNAVLIWGKRFGGNGVDRVEKAVSDGSGNIIVAGVFSGTTNWGTQSVTSAGGLDVFVAKLDTVQGNVFWLARWGGVGDDSVHDVAVHQVGDRGDVAVVGSFSGSVSIGDESLSSNGVDSYVVKLSGINGNVSWVKRFDGNGDDSADAVGMDPAGDVIVAGSFQDTVNLGASAWKSSGMRDLYLAKLSGSAGALVWGKTFGSQNDEFANIMALDSVGNIALGGGFIGSLARVGGKELVGVGGVDAFVAKYSESFGAPVWSKALAGDGADLVNGVFMKNTGEVIACGSFTGINVWGNESFSSRGERDAVMALLGGADGNVSSIQTWGGSGEDSCASVSVDSAKRWIVSSEFSESMDWLGQSFQSAGSADAIVFKMEASAG